MPKWDSYKKKKNTNNTPKMLIRNKESFIFMKNISKSEKNNVPKH